MPRIEENGYHQKEKRLGPSTTWIQRISKAMSTRNLSEDEW